MDYLKYYWLEEDYLEKDVRQNFFNNHSLKAKEFFSIIRWKSPQWWKKLITEGLISEGKSLDKAVYDLTKRLYNTEEIKEKLEIFLGNKEKKQPRQKGFQLAMASTVLTILYPEEFTIYDWRVRSQLINPKNIIKKYPDITSYQNVVEKYFHEYIPQVLKLGRKISGNKQLSLRDCDRLLWAKSWHEDLENFLRNR